VSILQFLNHFLPFINIFLLQGRSDLLIWTPLLSLIPRISLSDLRRVSPKVRVLKLGS
jgi:hypothetical protein